MFGISMDYVIFMVVLMLALVIDMGVLERKNKVFTIKKALRLTLFWIIISIIYFSYTWITKDRATALSYLSAYITEWSLSVDNVFVFVIIIGAFKIHVKFEAKALLYGVLLAIVLRVLFITLGVELIEKFHWILYFFGAFLIYTGIKLLKGDQDDQMDPLNSKVYVTLKKWFPIDDSDGNGKIWFKNPTNGKKMFSIIFVIIVMLALIDIVFALDSIPAVLSITQDKIIVYSSNIFAVLGLRSLYFLVKGASQKFYYLPYGIAFVLVFIGLKIMVEDSMHGWVSKESLSLISFIFIIFCIFGSIFYSIFVKKPKST
ncbi:MAG: TerC/Alx family metal homeostasis membrane protein [Alphaproteobacteria bacterium]|nr:TerC/Alx family metal homeostasis membrane protein [Alphaproteobacteria bacterium]